MNEEKKKDDFDAVRELVETLKSFSEEDQKRIIRWAGEKLGISGSVFGTNELGHQSMSTDEKESGTSGMLQRTKDIKAFVNEKNPKSDNHFVAVVAYYYQFEAPEGERKDSITKSDLVEATRLAVYGRLKRPDQNLVNAMHAGLLNSKSRGHYSLNSVGENLVAMILPDTKNKNSGSPHKVKSTKKNHRKKLKKSSGKK